MRPLFLFFISNFLFLNYSSAQQSAEIKQPLYFASASAELDQAATTQLTELVGQIQRLGDYRLEIAAHTDSRGSNTYNEKLAFDRAQSVSDFLKKHQINTDQMKVLAFGEQQAGNDLNSEQNLQKNRRVDIVINGWMWDGMTAFWDSLSNPLVQSFNFDPTKDILIEGAKGGRFFIPANSIVNVNGDLMTETVALKLTECYSIGDMLSLGLTTTAQNKILESGGMFELVATSKGEEALLKEGSSIAASIPTDDLRDGMSMFYGEGHIEQTNKLDWMNSEDAVNSSLPQLKIAPKPRKPSQEYFRIEGRKLSVEEIMEIAGLEQPKMPVISRPYRPREPNYDRIEYRPRGLDKLLVSKAKRQALTDSMRTVRKDNYNQKLAIYNARKPKYDARMDEYNQKMATFEATKNDLIDKLGHVRKGSSISVKLQRLADLAYEKALAVYKKSLPAYEVYRERKLAEYEVQMDALGMIDQTNLQKYFMRINQLGWANIDRFMKQSPRTMLAAKEFSNENNTNAMVFLIFPERNIILRMNGSASGNYRISSVPMGEAATILALKVENQKVYMANESITTTENLLVDLNYRSARLKDIRQELAAM